MDTPGKPKVSFYLPRFKRVVTFDAGTPIPDDVFVEAVSVPSDDADFANKLHNTEEYVRDLRNYRGVL